MGGFAGGIVDTFTSLVGGKTSSEKAAEKAQSQQKASMLSAKAEADAQLQERQKRMQNKQAGRGSLLSGTELGVQSETPLTKTLG